ncbi:MAG: type II toxin-antitoxin system RelE/ParE family toxin [Ignavibacteriaceae bacterium]|nr:type II toxin-antitoxin system RelE/ParE family toxin [Ignavibacteriaceae bacterium]
MSYKYEFHEEVSNDYIDAYTWYESAKKGLGERFLLFVRKKMDQIAENPEHYGERTRSGYREAQVDVFPYLIVFKIYKQKKLVFVVSIHSMKKDPRKKYRK